MIKTTLIDARNFQHELPLVLEAMRSAAFIGLDCETEDSGRHEGLNRLMKVDDEGYKSAVTKLVFDTRRTTMCGFSVFPEGSDRAWYVNLAHADVDNRIPWFLAKRILDARPANGSWVCHNAPFEITMFHNCHGFDLDNVICTMQLSVTAFGDDNYDVKLFQRAGLKGLERWLRPLYHLGVYQNESGKFSDDVEEIIETIVSKTSDAAHSYNGYVDELAWGHGLKQLVKRIFDYDMGTFKATLGDSAHMGQLTGEQVAEYGAEDAFWVIPLFRWLLEYVATTSPDALDTFFTQENPMIYVYSELWRGGMQVNFPAIMSRRSVERAEFANLLRSLRACLKNFSFSSEPNAQLLKREKWYKNYERYRSRIAEWVALDDHEDDYEECMRVSNAVPNAWAAERGDERKGPLSITHYMPMRTILYDLLGAPIQFDMGKVASDGEARGKLKDKLTDPNAIQVIECLNAMAGVEQRMKLFLTPYVLLTDPETQKLYPVVNSLLNSRRMAASTPNPMQLAKRGESTYIRGFFEGDDDDHLIVSLDWSAIELVIIGELSQDPEFFKAYGQLPHGDLHTGAAASVLAVEMPWITDDHIHFLKRAQKWSDFFDNYGLQPEDCTRLMTNVKGEALAVEKARPYWRTVAGKETNFNYWYSGFLFTTGQKMGWSMQTIANATDLYRSRFATAEEWRVQTIHDGQDHGFVQLPDGHRRFRYEATYEFMESFVDKWPEDLAPFAREVAKRIRKRANNQLVNSMVQGTCATIMKRSILRMRDRIKHLKARFMIPIHDEKVWSVHYRDVVEFIHICREVMTTHPDLFKVMKLDATPAVGVTFEPWHEKKAPYGQIELTEPPAVLGLGTAALNDNGIEAVVDYLRHGRRKMAA